MTEYFAVLGDFDRRGPFETMREPVALIKEASKALGHTDEEAQHFFLYQSAVEQVDSMDGKEECVRLGWQARERSGRELTTDESEEVYSCDEIYRKREDYLAEEHFTLTARKAAEVNEGGLVDPILP